ncbi:hypothetical protein AC578_6225 [Pseudocercospora eumusae]|uniref:Uncharacterized protein n=1 Tax=Pseudocercospora eumusae TaxID=321146 RepID=A0A139H352_9PEZI|nr:hypothetical protein AC578_6225 [Pseudocercospora eumusae]
MGTCLSTRNRPSFYPSDDLFHKSPTTMPELVIPDHHPASPKFVKDSVSELRHELFVHRPCAAALHWGHGGRRKRSSSWPNNKTSSDRWESPNTSVMEWDEKV